MNETEATDTLLTLEVFYKAIDVGVVGHHILVWRGPFAAARAKRRSTLKTPLYATRVTDGAELGFVPSRLQAVFFVEEAPYGG